MADVLLTHGYFLAEDEKERQIYGSRIRRLACYTFRRFWKTRGYSVEIFDSTFAKSAAGWSSSSRAGPGVVGVYTTLMTRRSVLEIVRAAKRHDWSRGFWAAPKARTTPPSI